MTLNVADPAEQYAWLVDMNYTCTRLLDPLAIFLHSVATSHSPGPHTSVLDDIAAYCNLAHIEFRADDKKAIDVIAILPELKGFGLAHWQFTVVRPTMDLFLRLIPSGTSLRDGGL